MIQKYKSIFSILLVNILLYIVHIFTAKHVITLILSLVPGEYKSGGFGGLALLLFIGQVLLVVYGLLGSLIVWLILSKKRYVVLSFITFILLLVVEIGVDTFQVNNQIEESNKALHKVLDPAIKKAKDAKIEILDFQDQGTLDEEGYLQELSITLKIRSNINMEIGNPIGICALGIHTTYNNQRCFYDIPDDKTPTDPYKIIKGDNTISKTFKMKPEGYTFQFIRRDEYIPFIINVGFYVYYNDGSGSIGNATVIDNVTDLTNTPKPPRLNFGADDILFQTKPYKIRFQ